MENKRNTVNKYEKTKMDEFFVWFEENKFLNQSINRRETNLVYEFCDFVEDQDNLDVIDEFFLCDGEKEEISRIVENLSFGCNRYLKIDN